MKKKIGRPAKIKKENVMEQIPIKKEVVSDAPKDQSRNSLELLSVKVETLPKEEIKVDNVLLE